MDGKRGIASVGMTTNAGDNMSGEGVQKRAKLTPRSRLNIPQATTPIPSSRPSTNGGNFMFAPPTEDDEVLEDGEIPEADMGEGDDDADVADVDQENGDGSGEGQEEAGEANNQDDDGSGSQSDASTQILMEQQGGTTGQPAQEPADESADDEEDVPVVPGYKPHLTFGDHPVESGNQADGGEDSGSTTAPAAASTAAVPAASTGQEGTPTAGQGPTIFDGPEPMDADMAGADDGVPGSVSPQAHDQGTSASAPENTMGGSQDPMPPMHQQASVEWDDTDMVGWFPSVANPVPESTATAPHGHQVPQAAPAQEQSAPATPYEKDQQQQAPLVKGYLLDVCEHMQGLVAPLATADGQGIRALELHSLLEEASKALKANGDDGREKMRIFHAQASSALREAKQAINGAEQALGSRVDELTRAIDHLGHALSEHDRRPQQGHERASSSKKRNFDEILRRDERPRKSTMSAQLATASTDVHMQEHIRVLSEQVSNVSSAFAHHARQQDNLVETVQELRLRVDGLENNIGRIDNNQKSMMNAITILGQNLAPGVSLFPAVAATSAKTSAGHDPSGRQLEVRVYLIFRGDARAPGERLFVRTTTLDLSDAPNLREIDFRISKRYLDEIWDAFHLAAATPTATKLPDTKLPDVGRTMRIQVAEYARSDVSKQGSHMVDIKSEQEYQEWLQRMLQTDAKVFRMTFDGILSADADMLRGWQEGGFEVLNLASAHRRWFTRKM